MSSSSAVHSATLIFLHGLGDRGSSWQMQLAPMLPAHVKCLCPTAPKQPVTLNLGMECNSWFDLRSLNPQEPEDEAGIQAASRSIHELIEQQEQLGVPADRIMLAGFSQGGALSLYAAFTYPKRLAGVVALSCWLPLHGKFPALAGQPNRSIPVLQCHGDQDYVVPLAWGQASSRILSTFLEPTNYQFKVYRNLGHSSSGAELSDVLSFIAKNLAK